MKTCTFVKPNNKELRVLKGYCDDVSTTEIQYQSRIADRKQLQAKLDTLVKAKVDKNNIVDMI